MEIRGITIPFSKNKGKQLHQKERDIQNRLQVLDRVISNRPNTDCIKNEINEYNNLKEEIDLIYQKKGKGSIIRSKCKWIERGEKPTAFFFNLEKRNYNRKSIKKLEGAEGTALTNEDEILNEIETFFKKLFNSGLDENDLFDLFVQGLKAPKLQDQQRNQLEGEITLAECKVVLRTFSNGKSPGEDGFTWEFHNCFFDLLGQDLVNCFIEAYVKGEMSILQRRGVISLLPKEDANLLKLANWPPITLLNVDYKIASKGITVFQKELKLSQFADDTSVLCNDCNSVNRAITVLNSFGILSGLRLNPSKTKALWLGSLRNRKDEPFNFKAKSLKLAWISRFLQSVPTHDDE